MENIFKTKGMLCNIRKTIKRIIVCNRVKDDCNCSIYFPASSYLCFLFLFLPL